MHSTNRDAPDCPDGYRRYVYRVKVSVPFKEQFRQEPPTRRPDSELARVRQVLDTEVRLEGSVHNGRLVIPFDSKERFYEICDHIK